MAVRHDLQIEKGAKFYREFQLDLADGNPEDSVGFEIRCYIKESPNTSTILHELTEANGGIVILNDPTSNFAISISSTATKVDVDYAYYDIVRIDSGYPASETQRLIEGRIEYLPGVTV